MTCCGVTQRLNMQDLMPAFMPGIGRAFKTQPKHIARRINAEPGAKDDDVKTLSHRNCTEPVSAQEDVYPRFKPWKFFILAQVSMEALKMRKQIRQVTRKRAIRL